MQKLCVSVMVIMLSGCALITVPVKVAATTVSVASKTVTTTAKVAATVVDVASTSASAAGSTADTALTVAKLDSNKTELGAKILKQGIILAQESASSQKTVSAHEGTVEHPTDVQQECTDC